MLQALPIQENLILSSTPGIWMWRGPEIVKALCQLWIYWHVCAVLYAEGDGLVGYRGKPWPQLLYILSWRDSHFPCTANSLSCFPLWREPQGGANRKTVGLLLPSPPLLQSGSFLIFFSLSMLVVGEGCLWCWSSCDLARRVKQVDSVCSFSLLHCYNVKDIYCMDILKAYKSGTVVSLFNRAIFSEAESFSLSQIWLE